MHQLMPAVWMSLVPGPKDEVRLSLYRSRADRIMLWVCGFMTLVCLALASVYGMWADALLVALPTLGVAIWLVRHASGAISTRLFMACAFMAYSALVIHLLLGDIEAHFSAFGLIGVLLYYRDWRVIVAATVFIYVHHLILGLAQSVGAPFYVFDTPEFWPTFLIHVAYFLPFIGMMCLLSIWLKSEGLKQQEIIQAQSQQEALLRETARYADEANAAKSKFLATMSHELRTPMNGILGMAQMLSADDATPQQVRLYAKTILQSGQSLLGMINDILNLSKIESGTQTLQPERFNPEQLLGDVAMLFSGHAKGKGIALKHSWKGPSAQTYLGDPSVLRQMLTNYVSNALKFTHVGTVEIGATEIQVAEGLATLEFSVSDTGIGIAASQQSQLFKPFSQIDDSSTRPYGGTGLGLAIVKSLAALMNGHVGVNSAERQGARFWFRVDLPVADAETLHPLVESAPADGWGLVSQRELHGRILLVEDHKINQIVAKTLLEKMGVTVDTASNGQEALDHIMAAASPPELILMDVQMPVLDGLAAARKIRLWEQQQQRAPIPIVAITAGAFPEDEANCLDAGMDGFLTKPVEYQKLFETVAKYLASQHQAVR